MISSRNLDEMPDPTQLKRLLQSLAMLDAIVSPDWDGRYYSYSAGWSDQSEMGSMRNGCGDHWFALLTARGVGIVGLAHESAMFRHGEPRPGMFDGLPDALSELRSEPAFDSNNCSFCLWCLAADGTWRRGPVEMAAGHDPDGSAELLHLFDLDPESYVKFAADYYEVMLPIDAVEAIYAHDPLQAALVSRLNEDVSLADLQPDLAEIGYPSRGPSRTRTMEAPRERKLRTLFVCTMNQWRSPTAEAIWRRSPNVDVRSRGLSSSARRTLSRDDLQWADLVFVMTHEHRDRLVQQHRSSVDPREIVVLEIPDEYQYMDPELVELLQARAGPVIDDALASEDETHGEVDDS